MINVKGGEIRITGRDETVKSELSLVIGMVHSRLNARGHNDEWVDRFIRDAIADAKLYDLDKLRMEARAHESAERFIEGERI